MQEPDVESLVESYQRKFPFKVLYLEDDVSSAERVRSLFEDEAIDFRIAPSPEEADDTLASEVPDLVITDHRLGDSVPTGESWLIRHFDQLQGAKKIMLTGFPTELQERGRLRAAGVTIVTKGEPEEDELWEQLRRMPREKAARLIQRATEEFVGPTVDPPGQPDPLETILTSPIKKLFYKWAADFEDRDLPRLFLGTKAYSVRELVAEVQRGSEVGITVLEMFTEDLEDLL